MKKMIANTMASIANLTGSIGSLTSSVSPHSHSISAGMHSGQVYNGGNYTTVTSAAAGTFNGNLIVGTISTTPVTLTLGKNHLQGVKIMLDGNPIPEGEEFAECGDLFVVNTKLDAEINNQFHYQTWITIHGAHYRDYGTIVRSVKGCFIAFGSSETKEHYLNWFEDYRAKFFADYDDMSAVALPKLSQGDVAGIYVPDNPDHLNASYHVFRAADIGTSLTWAWIVEHCHRPVVRIDGGWIFKDASDAVLFKMR